MAVVAYLPQQLLHNTYAFVVIKKKVQSKFTGEIKECTFSVQLATRTTEKDVLIGTISYVPYQFDKFEKPCEMVGDMPKTVIQHILDFMQKQLNSRKHINFLSYKSTDEQVDIMLKSDIRQLELAYKNANVPFGWYIDGMCRIIKVCIAVTPGDVYNEEFTYEVGDTFDSPYSTLACDMLIKLIDR